MLECLNDDEEDRDNTFDEYDECENEEEVLETQELH